MDRLNVNTTTTSTDPGPNIQVTIKVSDTYLNQRVDSVGCINTITTFYDLNVADTQMFPESSELLGRLVGFTTTKEVKTEYEPLTDAVIYTIDHTDNSTVSYVVQGAPKLVCVPPHVAFANPPRAHEGKDRRGKKCGI